LTVSGWEEDQDFQIVFALELDERGKLKGEPERGPGQMNIYPRGSTASALGNCNRSAGRGAPAPKMATGQLKSERAVSRLVGIVCLGYRLQVDLKLRFSRDERGKARRAQWTVTDRVSPFWCAQHLFHDPGADWTGWLAEQWEQLIAPDSDLGPGRAS